MKRLCILSLLLALALSMTAQASLMGITVMNESENWSEAGINVSINYGTEVWVMDYDGGQIPEARYILERTSGEGPTQGTIYGSATVVAAPTGTDIGMHLGYQYEKVEFGQIEATVANYENRCSGFWFNVVPNEQLNWENNNTYLLQAIHHCFLRFEGTAVGENNAQWHPKFFNPIGPMVQTNPPCPGTIPPGA